MCVPEVWELYSTRFHPCQTRANSHGRTAIVKRPGSTVTDSTESGTDQRVLRSTAPSGSTLSAIAGRRRVPSQRDSTSSRSRRRSLRAAPVSSRTCPRSRSQTGFAAHRSGRKRRPALAQSPKSAWSGSRPVISTTPSPTSRIPASARGSCSLDRCRATSALSSRSDSVMILGSRRGPLLPAASSKSFCWARRPSARPPTSCCPVGRSNAPDTIQRRPTTRRLNPRIVTQPHPQPVFTVGTVPSGRLSHRNANDGNPTDKLDRLQLS